jgi:hypothetical protein
MRSRRAPHCIARPLNCALCAVLLRGALSPAAQNRLMPFDLSEAQLKRTELLLGARFPESYRRSMLVHNGGERDLDGELWELLPIRDDRSERRSSATDEDVLGWTDEFRMWRSWPKGAISIARNGVGDALLFLRERERIRPEVYVWRHENGALEKIASDFGEVPSA